MSRIDALRMATVVGSIVLMGVPARSATLTWDSGGGVSNQWSYQSGGLYKNWSVETALPGSGDSVTIAVSSNKSVLDYDAAIGTTAVGHTVVGGTASSGASFEIPAGRIYTHGSVSPAYASHLRIGYNAGETGSVLVAGTVIANSFVYSANAGVNSMGTLTVTNGGAVNIYGGGLNLVAGTIPSNSTGVVGARGTVNLHGGTINILALVDVNVASSARAAGSTLSHVGVIDFRGGSLMVTNRTLYLGSTDGGGLAILRGYGKIGKLHPTTGPVFRFNTGTVTADGDGVNANLDLSECGTFNMATVNSDEGTNGWYAIEKGQLLWPSRSIANGGTLACGANTQTTPDPDPDMVNSVVWSNCACPATFTVASALLAPDRTGLGLPGAAAETVGVWEFTPSGVSTVGTVIVRYDHLRAAALGIPEDQLQLFGSFNGAAWTSLSATIDTNKNQFRASSVVMPVGTHRLVVGVLAPTVSLASSTTSVTEGNSGTTNASFVVQLSRAVSYTTSVDFATVDGTASNGSDYTAASGTLTFSPGATCRTGTVMVTGDTDAEFDETFSLILANPVDSALGAVTTSICTIVNDDAGGPQIENSAADVAGVRACLIGQATYGSNCTVTFYWGTNDGLTVAGAWGASSTLPGTFDSPALVSNSVAGMLPDTTYWFTCFVSNSLGTSWAQPSLSFTSQVAVVAVNLGAQVSGVSAGLVGGIAAPGVAADDVFCYWGRAGAGYSATNLLTGPFAVGAEFTNRISGLLPNTAYQYTYFATNSDGASLASPEMVFTSGYPTVQFTYATNSGAESITNVNVSVSLSEVTPTNVTVQYAAADGTAVAGSDYQALSGTLTIPAGQLSATFGLTVLEDIVNEGDETVIIGLSNATHAVVGAIPSFTYTIQSNDWPVAYVWDGGGGAANVGWTYSVGGLYKNWDTESGYPGSVPGIYNGFTISGSYTAEVQGASSIALSNTSRCVVGGANPLLKILAGGRMTINYGNVGSNPLEVGGYKAGTETGRVEVSGTLVKSGYRTYVGLGGAGVNSLGVLTIKSGGVMICTNAAPMNIGSSGSSSGSGKGTLSIENGGTCQYSVSSAGGTVGYITLGGWGGTTADTLGSSEGILDLRGGVLLFNPPDANNNLLKLGSSSTNTASKGTIQGYGRLAKQAGAPASYLIRFNTGKIIADGDGANADLDLSDAVYSLNSNGVENTTDNGYYAVEKGRLLLMPSPAIGAGSNYVFGENVIGTPDLDPDLVNSVVWVGIGYSGSGLTNQGALLAVDRDGLALPINPNGAVGVWEFNQGKAIATVTNMIFRYDHVRAGTLGIPEASLKLFVLTNGASAWLTPACSVNTTTKQLSVSALANLPAGTNRFVIGSEYPVVNVSSPTLLVAEGHSGASTVAFVAQLNWVPTNTVTVNYATADGSASAGSDYTAASGILTFLPGSSIQTAMVSVAGDTDLESDETFTVTLSNPTNILLGAATVTTCTILNDDTPPSIANAGATVNGQTATLKGTITWGEGCDVTVYWGTNNGGTSASAWMASQCVAGPLGNGAAITNVVSGLLPHTVYYYTCFVSNSVGTRTNWAQPSLAFTSTVDLAVSITASDADASEIGPDPATFVVSRGTNTAGALTVNLGRSGTAQASDYTPAIPSTVVIPDGSNSVGLTITPVADEVFEGSETLILTLLYSTNYISGASTVAQATLREARFQDMLNDSSDPIGGGTDYSHMVDSNTAAYYVTTVAGLTNALKHAVSNDVIYVADTAELDLTGLVPDTVLAGLAIPGGVTLASGRGRNGSLGALLYTRDTWSDGNSVALFRTSGHNVRFTGLRLQGAGGYVGNSEDVENVKQAGVGSGIRCDHFNFEADNNEFFYWDMAAVWLFVGNNNRVHHNDFHTSTHDGYGYGIWCGGSGSNLRTYESTIECNLFDRNRHHIASSCSFIWKARHNIVMPNSISHQIDRHRGIPIDTAYEYNWTSGRMPEFALRYETNGPGVCYYNNNWTTKDHLYSTNEDLDTTCVFKGLYQEFWNVSATNNITNFDPAAYAPVVSTLASTTSGAAPLAVSFSDGGSVDPEGGSILRHQWWFVDGNGPDGKQAWTATATNTFTDPGIYDVRHRVFNTRGVPGDAITRVTVLPPDGGYWLTMWMNDSYRETNFPGFYKKQILLDDQIIWEDDFAGDEGWQHVVVNVTTQLAGRAGGTAKIAIRMATGNAVTDPTNTIYAVRMWVDDVHLLGGTVVNEGFEQIDAGGDYLDPWGVKVGSHPNDPWFSFSFLDENWGRGHLGANAPQFRVVGASAPDTYEELYQEVAISDPVPANRTLTVVSAYGGASPGTVTAGSGTVLSQFVTNSPVSGGAGTQMVCMAGTVAGNAYTKVNATQVTLTLTNDATLTWQWQTQYSLTTATNGNGSITAADGWYASGSTSVLTAAAATGWHFVDWSGDTNGCGMVGNEITVVMSQARSITATFAINQYTLTYTAGANGSISGTSPQTVDYGGSGTAVTAVPNTGYHFVDWSDANTNSTRTDVNVTGNLSVTANFAINQYTLTYTAGANGSISGTSPQTVNYGGSGTAVSAVPNATAFFVNWSDANTNSTRTEVNVTSNISLTANFSLLPVVTLTSPTNGQVYATAPATISMAATVVSNGQSIAKVQFLNGANVLNEDTTPPYAYTWTNVVSSNYNLLARAVFTGGTSTSAMSAVTVVGVPSPWLTVDVGAVGVPGSAGATNGVFTVVGSGADIWGTADACVFVYQPMTGDGEIKARFKSLGGGAVTNAKVGLVIRETLLANSKNAYVCLSATNSSSTNSYRWQRRTSTGGTTANTGGGGRYAGTTNNWIRLLRSNNWFNAYKSTNGINWVSIGAQVQISSFATNSYIGIAVTAGTNAALSATGVVDNVTAVP